MHGRISCKYGPNVLSGVNELFQQQLCPIGFSGTRRVHALCSGHWGTTSGDSAKFGLRAREIVALVDELAARGMLKQLQLLHFHIGSQVRRSCCAMWCHVGMQAAALLHRLPGYTGLLVHRMSEGMCGVDMAM
jgi:hypothetical protein